ncbi:MAG: DUF799 family lipoprotein [Deltaproteobacteria bacterium]|nr:DUF799 family lipoprotein [Deltaproteobacteria bacterium]
MKRLSCFRPNHLLRLSIYLLTGLILLSGCVHYQGDNPVPTIVATTEAFKAFDGEYENTPYFQHHKPVSIAVLPFTALEVKSYSLKTNFVHPEDIVRAGMYNHISSLPFKDLEIFDTDTRLANAGLKDPESVERLLAENPKKLKAILGVDAVVSGEVTHFDQIFLGVYSQVAVGCEVKMRDLDTGNLLWRAKHVSRAHAGGVSLNPLGMLMAAVASVWNLRDSEMLSQTDEVFREIASTIELPESFKALQVPPPRIDLFACINAQKPFTAGQPVSFRLIGDKDGSAYVDIGEFKSAIPLKPLTPQMTVAVRAEVIASIEDQYRQSGHHLTEELTRAIEKELAAREIYEGVYTVEPGEQMYGLMAKAYLADHSGSRATSLDPVHIIDIDARPPEAVDGLAPLSFDRRVELTWRHCTGKDVVGYEVWASRSPFSGYALAQTTENNRAVMDGLENFVSSYAKVRAVDRAGNRGAFSAFTEVVALPEPDLFDLPQPGPVLGGDLTASVLLTEAKSPYTVQSSLVVTSDATLHVAPGVTILFMPGTVLSVQGGSIACYGSEKKGVRLGPVATDSPPGSWGGVVLGNSGHALLRYTRIEKAATGLTIANSRPLITRMTITASSQAGLYLKDNARPNITCSIIADNQGQGGMVVAGEGIAPAIQSTTFLNNSPFDVQNYAPVELDLTNNYWGDPNPGDGKLLGPVIWMPRLDSPPDRCGE